MSKGGAEHLVSNQAQYYFYERARQIRVPFLGLKIKECPPPRILTFESTQSKPVELDEGSFLGSYIAHFAKIDREGKLLYCTAEEDSYQCEVVNPENIKAYPKLEEKIKAIPRHI